MASKKPAPGESASTENALYAPFIHHNPPGLHGEATRRPDPQKRLLAYLPFVLLPAGLVITRQAAAHHRAPLFAVTLGSFAAFSMYVRLRDEG